MSEVKKLITEIEAELEGYKIRKYNHNPTERSLCVGIKQTLNRFKQAHASDVAELNKRIDDKLEILNICEHPTEDCRYCGKCAQSKMLELAKNDISEVLGGTE